MGRLEAGGRVPNRENDGWTVDRSAIRPSNEGKMRMPSARLEPRDICRYLIPAERRHAWWLYLAIVGSCKLRGETPPPLPDFATPLLFAEESAFDHDPLAPRVDDSGHIVVPGSL